MPSCETAAIVWLVILAYFIHLGQKMLASDAGREITTGVLARVIKSWFGIR